ncbi:hypothetical protein DYB26_001357 [Aphanomyces astaci]|uniref:Kinesin-like protein n=1 Tax=Aphanomyces astaci TaxID=112090 RepID=A0A3R7DUR1_APHAT|nr:hypothetical protein DYB26_001357 [Aphanomyces astaci]
MGPDTSLASSAPPTTSSSSCAIRVVVRVRPMSQKEKAASQVPVVEVTTKNSLQLRQPGVGDQDTNPPRTFLFDHCYGDALSTGKDDPVQEALFGDIGRDIVVNAFGGFNCSVFAYGQTGSGKTYTMVGDKSERGKGLIPRICEALFDAIDKARAKDSTSSDDPHKTIYSVHERVKDLLDEVKAPMHGLMSPTADSRPLKIREHPVHGPFVEGLITRPVGSYAETSKICLVDLAGSERSDTSGTSGDRLKEASMINKSLFTLGRVISSLGAKERIPYRDSTLTWLLKESLGGNAKSAKKIINRAVVNEDENDAIIRQLRNQIEDLKSQLMGSQRRRSSETSAGLVKSLLEREEMLGQLQRDVKRHEKCLQLPCGDPSLINLQEDLLDNEPLAYVLEPGMTVLGADPTATFQEPGSTTTDHVHRRSSFLGDVILQQADNQAVHPVHLTHDADTLLPVHVKILNDKGFITLEPCPSAIVYVNGSYTAT